MHITASVLAVNFAQALNLMIKDIASPLENM